MSEDQRKGYNKSVLMLVDCESFLNDHKLKKKRKMFLNSPEKLSASKVS